jgi:serine/threonine-protein kinase
MRAFVACVAVFTSLVATAVTLPEFPPNAVWSRDVSQAPLNANSSAMITATGGWGNGNTFQIDQSMHVIHVSAANEGSVPKVAVVDGPYGYTSPDCEPEAGLMFPLPVGGAIEGSANYTCDNANNDCHLFVVLDGSRKLYESYQSNVVGGQLQSGCVIIWDLNKVHPPQGRGEQCTSADAAGFPMASLLFNADEVYAAIQSGGDLGHAIRFVLPNASMASLPPVPPSTKRQGLYVHPASHGGAPSGASNKLPYGSRLRLKVAYNISGYSVAAQAVLRTMKRYGIVLADGGNIALTAEDDLFTTHKWAEFGFDEINTYMEQMLIGVQLTDFEVVETGAQIPLTYDCDTNGNHLTPADFVFIDGFDY